MNNNDSSKIGFVKEFYETATESEIRGKLSNEAIYAYAYYVLDRIQLSKGKVLDVGCGDGK
jgi:2-polyprenyl-3-methyl-5-hydroxy-6-metoxy-1,4-benzoquinol methylase